MDIEFDPRKASANIRNHCVAFSEAETRLLDPLALVREEYDFSGAKRASEMPHLARLQAEVAKGKTRITISLDDDVLDAFRERAEAEGHVYQTLINDALRSAIRPECATVTAEVLRRILREELRTA